MSTFLSAKPCSPRAGQAATKHSSRKAQGLVLQTRAELRLRQHGRVQAQPWYEYTSREHGLGYCAPDFVLQTQAGLTVIDAKLTWSRAALQQLLGLYLPVVAKAREQQPSDIGVLLILGTRPRRGPLLAPTLAEALELCHDRRDVAWVLE